MLSTCAASRGLSLFAAFFGIGFKMAFLAQCAGERKCPRGERPILFAYNGRCAWRLERHAGGENHLVVIRVIVSGGNLHARAKRNRGAIANRDSLDQTGRQKRLFLCPILAIQPPRRIYFNFRPESLTGTILQCAIQTDESSSSTIYGADGNCCSQRGLNVERAPAPCRKPRLAHSSRGRDPRRFWTGHPSR